MRRIEELFSAQAAVRAAYWNGDIDGAIRLYDEKINPALGAVDPRVSRLARRMAQSFIEMVNVDLGVKSVG